MANGLLGKTMSIIGNNVIAYSAPTNIQFTTLSLTCVNQGIADSKIRIAISLTSTPAPVDFIEYDAVLPANGGVLERTCIVCSPGEKVIVFADTANIAVRIFGLEQL